MLNAFNRCLDFAHTLPIGSWHCCGCERNTLRIRRPDPEATTDVTSTSLKDLVEWPDRSDPKQRPGLLFRRKKKAKVGQTKTATESSSKFEHVGNVTRSDDSLLVRKGRAARYSKKFRESVVERLLTGKSTITQLRKELGLSERDLLDWIEDKEAEQDNRSKLTHVVDAAKHLTIDVPSNSKSSESRPQIYDADDFQSKSAGSPVKGKTIDGRVNRS